MRKAYFLFVFGMLITSLSVATVSLGQDDEGPSDPAAGVLDTQHAEPPPVGELRPGDEVVALRDANLKVGEKVVGNVRKGERLVVGKVQEKWVSVRGGSTSGWITTRSVISAALADWYQRLPDNESVEADGRSRAKLRGALFEILSPGSKGGFQTFDVNWTTPFSCAPYDRVVVLLEKRQDRRWALSVNFNPPAEMTSPPFPPAGARGNPYGTIQPGDYVLVDTTARQVFVNGQPRRAK